MKTALATAIGAVLLLPTGARTENTQSPPLKLIATVPLPSVAGRIDHLAFDVERHLLFVAALGNGTVEVVDTSTNRLLRSLPGFHEPQGITVVPESHAVAVANGDTGTLQLIDEGTFQTRWTRAVGGDADNVRYDAVSKRLFVAADGGLYAVDPSSGQIVDKLAIAGHPESFQFELHGNGAYANVPGSLGGVLGGSHLIALDRKLHTDNRWSTCGGNFPMALDEATHRLFVGCRSPASVAVIDTATGQRLSSVPTVGDTDDLFYDSERARLYVIGGEGAIDIFAREHDSLRSIARVTTRSGARTGLWVPSLRRLFVAAPARGGQPAEVRVFDAQ